MSERIIQVSKITSNRQVTIPAEVMKKLSLEAGDKIVWIEQKGSIIVRRT